MSQERLISPKELSQAVGLSVAQIRALMNEGRLEYVAISSKTRLLTMSGWEKFRQTATRAAAPQAAGQSSIETGNQ
ncbi:hypothetical protein ACTTAK_13940 [Rhodobacter capsulatus]|uniref:hypothetical protein n=1 Tax=Rhodobacter capsulatus TaxID=1061 RepID=UPI001142619E|nr:hypothetical protein [Rhodobacter capsulatus]TQD35579.1 hypothetical protein FKW81_08090 [Rhodobacter capsulatus]